MNRGMNSKHVQAILNDIAHMGHTIERTIDTSAYGQDQIASSDYYFLKRGLTGLLDLKIGLDKILNKGTDYERP